MDPQTCLKTSLKNKYQRLNEAYSDNKLLPSRLCFRSLKDFPSSFHLHEFRDVDKSDLHTWVCYETIPLTDILTCDCEHDRSQRTVISLGVCGVGKSTTVQSCALEWAEDKGYQNIHLLFPFTFWELNLIKNDLSMIELLQTFYPELKEVSDVILNETNVWFVFDGLDEFRRSLNFSCPKVSDVHKPSPVEDLVTNLIRGDLLPSAHIWITARYSAATKIPDCFLLEVTEVQGFSNEQKVEHFRKVINNDAVAHRAIDHVRISRSLYFLCKIPPICTIIATVLKDYVKPHGFEINPLSLTQIYMNLVKSSKPDIISKLKAIARLYMGEEDLMYEHELEEVGVSVDEASAFSKECSLVLREERGLNNRLVFRFGHASIQEFLAASAEVDDITANFDQHARCHRLVDQALANDEGKFDVFLRFIFGLIKECDILKPTSPLFDYTKKMILDNILNNRAVGLFHCLREYDSRALLDEVEYFLKFGVSPIPQFTPMHWHFMDQRATNFEGRRTNFNLELATSCDEMLLSQLPDILKSTKAKLRFSSLTDTCCPALATVLRAKDSYLRELDLGYNSITDDGVKKLVEGLISPDCKLKTLRLHASEMTSKACKYLATALKQSNKLRVLDLSRNEIGSDGMRHLVKGLKSPACHLEILSLSDCNIEDKGCHYLAFALQENSSYLKVLDLSINIVGDKAIREIFKKAESMQLTKLEIYHCGLSSLSCGGVAEALKLETCALRELNLSNNTLNDTGFAIICQGIYTSPLEKLNVSRCGITEMGCRYLAKALCSPCFNGLRRPTDWLKEGLRELDLSMNYLGDGGVRELVTALKCPYSNLKVLNLSHCELTDDCCAELAAGFAAKQSIISEVDLSENNIQDKGVRKLCLGLKGPYCLLEKLYLMSCGLTSRSIHHLMTALKSNPEHLEELHLIGNSLEESEIRALMLLISNPKYKLNTVDVTSEWTSSENIWPLPPYFAER